MRTAQLRRIPADPYPMPHPPRARALAVALVFAIGACAGAGASGDDPVVGVGATTTSTAADATTSATAATTLPAAPATSGTTSTTGPPVAPTTTAPPTTAPRQRMVHEQAWTPFATVGPVTLAHPSARIERVGFHESNHDGAQQLEPLPSAAAPITMETRDRGTGSRTAADVVADPALEIRAPVTGVVVRAGGYTLYCDNVDDYVVIEPDARPGWEVKVLHIDGVQVGAGQRVVAGETVLAPRPRVLPFESQVDEHRSADPAWPHVHIEVVDPSIPDRPSPGSDC